MKSFFEKNIYFVWAWGCVIFYLFVSLQFSKTMFHYDPMDGFTHNVLQMNQNLFDWYVLWPVHFLRYVTTYPFFWLEQNEYPVALQNILMLFYMLPVLVVKTGSIFRYLRFIILALPFVLSFRTCLTITSITLLFLYIHYPIKNKYAFLVSALFANLSSGVVLSWVALVCMYVKNLEVKRSIVVISFLVLSFCLCFSLGHKFFFFSGLEAVVISEGEGIASVSSIVPRLPVFECNSLFCKAMARNTILISWFEGNMPRFLVYLGLFILYLAIAVYCFCRKIPSFKFFAFAIPGFFFEGIWPISFVLCSLIFISEEIVKNSKAANFFERAKNQK